MTLRIKTLVCLAVVGGITNVWSIFGHPAQQWSRFFVYLAAVLLSSGMKVGLPKSEGTMSVNFPFILLGILQLSPLQAVALAACSVVAQCRIRVIRPFTLLQILFNVANVVTATALAWDGFSWLLRMHCAVAPALAVAAIIYFFSNTIPVALVIAWDQKIEPLSLWRRDFLWFLPFYLVGAILAALAYLIGVAFGWMTSLLLIPMVYTVYRAYSAQMAIIRDREQHSVDTEALHLRTIQGLAMAIEAKDKGTHRHLLRVRVYVAELGKLMGLDQPLMQALLTASFLHDIGKLAVPEYIINKPGKLTREEFAKMKTHPVVGADILERVRFPYPVVPIVRSHHESWDGSGYPDGLKGEEIPIGARLLTVVDCFDALASERPYRRAMPIAEAMAFVKQRAGIQFDPKIVDLLEMHYLELEERARKQIEEMEPLNTDLLIERGAEPGAGFEETQPESLHDAAAYEDSAALRDVSLVFGTSDSPSEAFAMFASRLQSFIPFDCMVVGLKSHESFLPHFIFSDGFEAFSKRPTPTGIGLSGWVAENGRPIVNGNPTVEPNYLAESGLLTATSSALSIPLFAANGSVYGVMSLYAAAKTAFSKEDLKFLQGIESKFAYEMRVAFGFKVAGEDAGSCPTPQPDSELTFDEHGVADEAGGRKFPPARETLAAL